MIASHYIHQITQLDRYRMGYHLRVASLADTNRDVERRVVQVAMSAKTSSRRDGVIIIIICKQF